MKAETKTAAIRMAKEKIDEESWSFVSIMEISLARREAYPDNPDSLSRYDEALENGIAAAFCTWETDEE